MKCKDKVKHKDKYSALLSLSKREKKGFETLRVYKCPKCKGWHLTSKGKYEYYTRQY